MHEQDNERVNRRKTLECTRVSKNSRRNKKGGDMGKVKQAIQGGEMGKVKQAIQEVEEKVVSLVKHGLSLKGIKLILGFEKHNPYMTNIDVVEKTFRKAVWERDNDEPYPSEDEIYKRYVYPLDKGEV